jgi:hypothetical protein
VADNSASIGIENEQYSSHQHLARGRGDLLVRIRTQEQVAFGKPEITLRDSGGNDRSRGVARRDHIRSAPSVIQPAATSSIGISANADSAGVSSMGAAPMEMIAKRPLP